MRIGDIIKEMSGDYFYHGSGNLFDKFDMSKVGSGDGLNKFGLGLYFTRDINTAIEFAKQVSIGKKTPYLYTVKLLERDNFYNWYDFIDDYVANRIINNLRQMGYEDDANQLVEHYEEYGNHFELYNIYSFIEAILESRTKTTSFLYKCGVSGSIGKYLKNGTEVYTAYSDRIIKIIDVKNLNDETIYDY